MSGSKKLMVQTPSLAVEDVFKVWRFTGLNNLDYPQTLGIDLAGKGGMVMLRNLTDTAQNSYGTMVFDTERGVNKLLRASNGDAEMTISSSLSAFSSTGFTVNVSNLMTSGTGENHRYSATVFRKAPKFFDVVTYVGNGTGNSIAHSLEQVPGMVWIKNRDSNTNEWVAWHKGIHATNGEAKSLEPSSTYWNRNLSGGGDWVTSVGSSSFTLSGSATNISRFNESGVNYVMYLFGDDDSDDGMIRCFKMYRATSGGGDQENANWVDLKWPTQYCISKSYGYTNTDGSAPTHWLVTDKLRGMIAVMNNSQGDSQDIYGHTVYSLDNNTQERKLDGTSMHANGEGRMFVIADGASTNVGNSNVVQHATGSDSSGHTAGNPDRFSAIYMFVRDEPQRIPTELGQIFNTPSVGGYTNTWDQSFYQMTTPSIGTYPTYNMNFNTLSTTGFEGWPPSYWIMREKANVNGHVKHLFRYLWAEKGSTPMSDPTWLSTVTATDLLNSQWTQGAYNDPDNASPDHPRGLGFSETLHTIDMANNQVAAFREVPGVCSVNYYRGPDSAGAADLFDHPHRLGTVPEMIWYKSVNFIYDASKDWAVYHPALVTNSKVVFLQTSTCYDSSWSNYVSPTATTHRVGGHQAGYPSSWYYYTNYAMMDYVCVMFASRYNVSKIGSFSHTNGSHTNVDCNFVGTALPRFMTIKRIDDTGDWITSAKRGQQFWAMNSLDTLTGTYVNAYTSGFQFDSSQPTGTYIFLAMR